MNRDYLEFIDGILLFRHMRDTGDFKEPWAEHWIGRIMAGDSPDEEKSYLRLMARLAELIDDRKPELLKEIDEDLHVVWKADEASKAPAE